MLTFAQLEQLVSQVAEQSAEQNDPTFVLAEDRDGEFILWPLDGPAIKLFLHGDGHILLVQVCLGELPEQRRPEVLESLLELNHVWQVLPLRITCMDGCVTIASQYDTQELCAIELGSLLADLRRLAGDVLPLIVGESDDSDELQPEEESAQTRGTIRV